MNYGWIKTTVLRPCTYLYHWGQLTHLCVSKQTIISSNNGFLPGWRQAIIWTNTGMLLLEPVGTEFSGNLIGIHTFSSGKLGPFCLGLHVLTMSHTHASLDYLCEQNGPWQIFFALRESVGSDKAKDISTNRYAVDLEGKNSSIYPHCECHIIYNCRFHINANINKV